MRMLKPTLRCIDTRTVKPLPKVADSIYHTPEYAVWRAAVIARAKGQCEDPTCKATHRPGQRLFADHIKELRDGGAPFDLANGMARCGSSHTLKTMAERARRMAARPEGEGGSNP